jgi:hypothetical protein
MKTMQGTDLDFVVRSENDFSVTHHKKYQICFRRDPADPLCKVAQATSLGEILLSWTVFCKDGKVSGTLKVGKFEFTKEATSYEKGLIFKTMAKPSPLPEEWKTSMFPEINRPILFLK